MATSLPSPRSPLAAPWASSSSSSPRRAPAASPAPALQHTPGALSPRSRSAALGHSAPALLAGLPASPRPLSAQALAAAAATAAPLAGHAQRVRHAVLLPGPRQPLLATAGEDAYVCLWDVAADLPHAPLPALRGHAQPVTCLAALAPCLLASGSRDGTVRVWRPPAPAPAAVHRWGGASAVRCLAPLPPPSPASPYAFAVGYEDGALLQWAGGQQQPAVLLPAPPHATPLAYLAALPCAGGGGGGVRLLSSRGPAAHLWAPCASGSGSLRLLGALTGHGGAVSQAVALGDGRLATACAADGLVRLYSTEELEGGGAVAPEQCLRGHPPGALSLCPHPAASQGGLGLCSAGSDGVLRVWGARAGHGALLVTAEVALAARLGALAAVGVVAPGVLGVAGAAGCALLHYAGFASRVLGLWEAERGEGGWQCLAGWGGDGGEGGEEGASSSSSSSSSGEAADEQPAEGRCWAVTFGGDGGAVRTYRVLRPPPAAADEEGALAAP